MAAGQLEMGGSWKWEGWWFWLTVFVKEGPLIFDFEKEWMSSGP